MSKIRPFAALRPSSADAPFVACLPYDVMNRSEAAQMAEGNPMSFLRIIRSEIECPTLDAYDEHVYERAKENLVLFEEKGYLTKDDQPYLYVYALTMKGRRQRGFVAGASIDEYLEGKIKKHEHTREVKEMDRIHHFDAVGAHTEPVFLTYRRNKALSLLLDQICDTQPVVDFVSEDDIRHTCWVVEDKAMTEEILRLFSLMNAVYIADGHHRSASAVKVGLKRRTLHPDYTGEEAFNFFPAVFFDEDELMIMDYNRVVSDLHGMREEEFLERVRESFSIKEQEEAVHPKDKGTFGMYLGGQWHLLKIREELLQGKEKVEILDASLLQDHLLRPLLGILDPRMDERIDFVGGIRGLKELERRVESDMTVAFSLCPVSMAELLCVADEGEIMPPKSTWFEPKLRSGLFVHRF